jgi:hypothetical protein
MTASMTPGRLSMAPRRLMSVTVIGLLILLAGANVAPAQTFKFQAVAIAGKQDNQYYWRHFCYYGELSKLVTPLDQADASFNVVTGLASVSGVTTVSFQSANYPHFYLRHRNWRVETDYFDNNSTPQNKMDASFIERPGNSGQGVSYESAQTQFRGYYIRHNGLHLWVNTDNGHDPFFKQDTTFLKQATGVAAPPTPIGERIAVYADCLTQPLASGVTGSNKQICIGRYQQIIGTVSVSSAIWTPPGAPVSVPAGPCPRLAVNAVGDGECTDLVQAALAFAHGGPGNVGVVPYTWGTPVGTKTIANAKRGDIIQFQGTTFTESNGGSWGTSDKHTAIISAINGNKVTLIEQNMPSYASPLPPARHLSPNLRAVQTSPPRDFSPATLTNGTYAVFRPTEGL